MTVFVIRDSKGKLCSIHSTLELAQSSRLRIDVPEFDIQEWEVDVNVFFAPIVDKGTRSHRDKTIALAKAQKLNTDHLKVK